MKENKLTPEEIKKALECCKPGNDEGCLNCPLHNTSLPECSEILFEETINLINRQQAEIERLQKVQVQYVKAYFDEFVERLKFDISLAELDSGLLDYVIDELVETMNNEFNRFTDLTDLIKSEAIKEFAERLKKSFNDLEYQANTTRKTIRIEGLREQMDWVLHSVAIETIDDLVKEMVGEQE